MKSTMAPNHGNNIILEDVVAFLKKVPPFQFLSDTDLQAVARNLSMEFYPKDMVILRQDGPPSDALRVIKKEKAVAEKRNAALQASAAEKAMEKEQLAAKKKEAGFAMPKAIFPLKNPGIYSMAAAFLMAFLVSLIKPEKAAEDKFAGVKVREYLGIGSEE